MITIIDYGMGNTGSIQNMFKYIGVLSEVTHNKSTIESAEKILLPGVGAFDVAMENIEKLELKELLHKKALQDKIPVLGICLGMQLMTNNSEEGSRQGLGWINAVTKKFHPQQYGNIKVPHMGWNTVVPAKAHALLGGFEDVPKFYFVHSYYVQAVEDQNVLAKTFHGQEFDSMITNGDNIFGAQFHPEKSHKYGMQLLKAFAEI